MCLSTLHTRAPAPLHVQQRSNALSLGCSTRLVTMPAVAEGTASGTTISLRQCGRPQLVTPEFRAAYADVCQSWPTPGQLSLVYSDDYNIHFFGIEKLHPFDACKYRHVVKALIQRQVITGREQLVAPQQVSREVLADVHTAQYLDEIHSSNFRLAQVTELAALAILPNFLLQWRIVNPMKVHVGGTMLAAGLALERGWAINIGGGMHHAHSSAGGGWCPFDDITLAVRRLRTATQGAVKKVLYIDLDAHQGNGVERDKLLFKDTDLIILDTYTKGIYPMDDEAMAAIDIDIPVPRGCQDARYLSSVEAGLARAALEYSDIDLVFYNAGTDILDSDPLGRLKVSAEAVKQRDEMVWQWALGTVKVPIVMTLSGGYTRGSAQVITDSIENLINKFKLKEQQPQPVQELQGQ